MKNTKRILTVTLSTTTDTNPDTSWLGEYSDKATSEFSIDRQHSEDCASQTYNVTVEGICTLKHAISYLLANYLHGKWPSDSVYVDDCSDASDLLSEALDATAECDCDGGDQERNEHRFFNPSFNYVDKNGRAKDLTAAEVRKYTRQDYERMESGTIQPQGPARCCD